MRHNAMASMIRPILLLIALFVLPACQDSHEWRQKLTLAIETPSGPVTASTVQAIRWTGLSGFAREAVSGLQGSAGNFKVTGEAAVIELTPGRYLFALLRGTGGFVGNPGENLAYTMLIHQNREGYVGTPETIAHVRNLVPGEPMPVPLNAWPMLVTFAEMTDPASVQRVDPRDLDAAFGCDREPAGLVLPWRAAGQVYEAWLPEEVLRRANAEASARAGITGDAAAALEETAAIRRPNWNPVKEERERLAVLERAYTREQKIAWEQARDALLEELPTLIPSPETAAAAWGGQCHVLEGVTLEVTEEPVTEGRVRELLGWLGFYPEPGLIKGDGRTTDIPFGMRVTHGDFWRGDMK